MPQEGLRERWTAVQLAIQKRHFHDFTPILDFVHAVEHLYEAARSIHEMQSGVGWTIFAGQAIVGAATLSR